MKRPKVSSEISVEFLVLRSVQRKLVRKFRAGAGFDELTILVWNASIMKHRVDLKDCRTAVEQVLRDYMNGKFKLDAKGKS